MESAGAGERNERTERVRAFVALAPPPATIEAIAGWQRTAIEGRDGLRPIGPDALHLTLAFLGDRDGAEIGRARDALLAAVEHVPVRIRLEPEPIGLPRRRPRVVAFAAVSPAAVHLHESLVGRLMAAGLMAPGGRSFRPHLSVARVRGDPNGPGGRRVRAAIAALPALIGPEGHTFDAVRAALYRSELRSQGASYSVLADVNLPHSGS